MSELQPPQEQPGVMSLRTQSTDIFTQLCSPPRMTMSQDVSNVLHWGRGGQGPCLCQRFGTRAKGLLLREPHLTTFKAGKGPALFSPQPTPYQDTPPHPKKIFRWTADDFITPPSPLTLRLCHSILITLIKSFVHLEISDDNLFHSTLQQWWLWREEN